MPSESLLAETLVRAGLLDEAALAHALRKLQADGGSFIGALLDLELASDEAIVAALAEELKLPRVESSLEEVPQEIVSLLPPEFCRARLVLPLGEEGRTLRLAMANPLDYFTIQDVEFRTNKRVATLVASEPKLRAALERLCPEKARADVRMEEFNRLADVQPAGELEGVSSEYDLTDIAQLAKDVKLPPIVRLVNKVLGDAALAGASDLHLEPQEAGLLMRQRVDGLLHDTLRVPRNLQDPIVSRIKIISGMDISERRRPQDGRSRFRFEGRRIDLRVSTLPTQHGEKVVIRLLDSRSAHVALDGIGFSPRTMARTLDLLSRPQGLFLVTGPTGSGKTTTLYAALNWLKAPERNIITVEDPIEYQIEGINQVQINTRAGMTFASGLRSILRQDPNVVLVGEIRDPETAGIALEAAQTGHLLLSTLHANTAAGAITRLLDLKLEPFLIASSLMGVMAQRLVRRPCTACGVEQPPDAEVVEKVGGIDRLPRDAAWKAGKGCPACLQSGYKGRLAVQELLVLTDEIRDLITSGAPEHRLRDAAHNAGMRSMLEDGIEKAAQGLTTLEDLLRTTPDEHSGDARGAVPADPQHGAAAAAPPAAVPEAPAKQAARVLVVEDSPTIVVVVKYFLELEGFEVLVATDGRMGLEMARSSRPDLIVTDLQMPIMDGLELVRTLREDPALRETAIMMLTSESSVESESRGLELGADDYVLKPVEPRRLAARVKALLSRRKMLKANA